MNCIVATLLALAVTAALGPRGFLLTAGASDMYPPLAEVTLRIAQTAARSVVIAVAAKTPCRLSHSWRHLHSPLSADVLS